MTRPQAPDRYDLFIDGAFSPATGEATFEDVNPATGEAYARVARATAEDVDRAVQAARRARSGPWGRMSVAERCALLDRVADRIDARREEFLAAEIADTGKPLGLASRLDIPRGAANFRIFADLARSEDGTSHWTDQGDGAGALNYVVRHPVGVVGVVCPWNLPLLLMTWKVAPALAVGNTVVVKPSEETPGTATLLASVFDEVGVPPGVYNVVHGFGPGEAGEALVSHPDVRAITFTGESATGSAIMRVAARDVKKVSFELGGKNPAVIFESADLERAIAGVARSTFTNCGQVCLCSERVYVHRSHYDAFVEGLKAAAEALVPGDPYDPQTTLGPLISQEHRRKVLSYFDTALEDGAEVITGGHLIERPGFYVAPTVWTGASEQARIVREEVFGPVCHVQPFDEEEEAIAMANDSAYGLCAALWTEDVRQAHRVARRVEAGLVWVNTWFLRDLRTPFGGVKLSGIGREGGRHSLDFYSSLKNVCVQV